MKTLTETIRHNWIVTIRTESGLKSRASWNL